ncbi:flagellar hook-length control protein FliK [Lederbergia panacisoli]|uniref:flagellar hook-length control protein FliK n=1 Tax=Lederbergia panacisoli TaxID=1255251 RepID=UPI00214A95A1|nr:flagellar hook-length control protein FliK [Lederbergia panacisoli]MCR2820717.1 flagellar hook-length control protein FliK [Lederbergia panacisoli]
MKIGGFESTLLQGTNMYTSPESNNTSFQMILGATLANDGQLLSETNSAPEMGSIMEVIDTLIGSSEIEETVENWAENVQEIFDWLKENVDPIHLPESIKLGEQLPEEFLAASVLLFQVITGINNEELKSLPSNKMSSFIKSVKVFLFTSHVVNLREMQQVEELEDSMEYLLKRLQDMAKDTKYQNIRNSLDNAFFKGKEGIDFRTDSNSSKIMVPSHLSNSNPVIRNESFILNVSESVNKETVMRGLIREFSNILARSSLTQGINTTKLLIRLHPEELGSLRVELLQKDGQLTARILASTQKAKEMLDFQLNSLRQAFTQQNISVDRIEVTYNQGDINRYTNQDSRGNGQQHQQQNQDHGQSQNETNDNFKDALSDILFETEV